MSRHRNVYDETDRLIVRTIVGSYPPKMRAEKDFPDRVADMVATYFDEKPPASLWDTYRKASRTVRAGVQLFLIGFAGQLAAGVIVIVTWLRG